MPRAAARAGLHGVHTAWRSLLERTRFPAGALAVATGYVAAGLALWAYPLLSPDSIDYAAVARNLVSGKGYRLDLVASHPGLLPGVVGNVPEWHGLLRPFELVPVFEILGIRDEWLKLPSVLYVGALSVVAFLLARRLAGTVAGYLAFFLVLASADVELLAAFGGDDVGSAFWTLLTLYGVCRVAERPSTRGVLLVGLWAAFGTLEKFTGVLLPFAVAAAMLLHPSTRRAFGVGRALLVVVPATLAAGLYLLRNYLAYGALDFRFNALEWLGKGDLAGYFAYYPVRPTTGAVWALFGIDGFINGVLLEFRSFLAMANGTFPVMYGGPIALLLLLRREPLFALASLVYGAGLVTSVCVGHEFENRYVISLWCIDAVAVAAVGTEIGLQLLARLKEPIRKPARQLATVLSIGALAALSARRVLVLHEAVRALPAAPSCVAAHEFLREHVPPEAPVLTSDPWLVVWSFQRPAVMAPTNGIVAVETVARHYRTDWVLVGPRVFGAPDLEVDLRRMQRSKTGLLPRLVSNGDDCRVYSLH